MLFTTYFSSPLGNIELAATQDHITAVMFAEAKKVKSLHLPASAEIPKILEDAIHQLECYFSGKLFEFDLPFEQEGTEFQQKIWKNLTQIPFGKTMSYLELTLQSTQNEKTIRAVASANGRNQLSLLVPCHRVIGSDGKLVGYAGDLWRKKWLLQHEIKYNPHKNLYRLFD
jgi:methylated-DNA-[protein]-cysteine S-methyltransferase